MSSETNLTLAKFGQADETALREIVDTLIRHDRVMGGYTTKVDARQGGFSMHVKFDKRTNVLTTVEIATVFEQSGERLCHVARKLLDLPDDYDPDAGP